MSPSDEVLQRLADKDEIHDLMNRWTRATQRREWEALRETYHPDAVDLHGSINGSVDEFVDWMKGYHETVSQVIFYNTNANIEFLSDDKAFVESNSLAVQRYTKDARDARVTFLGEEFGDREEETAMLFAGRYLDVVERRDGVWRYSKRQVVYESIEGKLALQPLPSSEVGLGVATRGKDDPLFKAREEVGLSTDLAVGRPLQARTH